MDPVARSAAQRVAQQARDAARDAAHDDSLLQPHMPVEDAQDEDDLDELADDDEGAATGSDPKAPSPSVSIYLYVYHWDLRCL
jgi:hypothetical protein